jgi:hypothetical protein
VKTAADFDGTASEISLAEIDISVEMIEYENIPAA